jgi:hypothetical protein
MMSIVTSPLNAISITHDTAARQETFGHRELTNKLSYQFLKNKKIKKTASLQITSFLFHNKIQLVDRPISIFTTASVECGSQEAVRAYAAWYIMKAASE